MVVNPGQSGAMPEHCVSMKMETRHRNDLNWEQEAPNFGKVSTVINIPINRFIFTRQYGHNISHPSVICNSKTMIMSFLQMLLGKTMVTKVWRHTLFSRDTIAVQNCLLTWT